MPVASAASSGRRPGEVSACPNYLRQWSLPSDALVGGSAAPPNSAESRKNLHRAHPQPTSGQGAPRRHTRDARRAPPRRRTTRPDDDTRARTAAPAGSHPSRCDRGRRMQFLLVLLGSPAHAVGRTHSATVCPVATSPTVCATLPTLASPPARVGRVTLTGCAPPLEPRDGLPIWCRAKPGQSWLERPAGGRDGSLSMGRFLVRRCATGSASRRSHRSPPPLSPVVASGER